MHICTHILKKVNIDTGIPFFQQIFNSVCFHLVSKKREIQDGGWGEGGGPSMSGLLIN